MTEDPLLKALTEAARADDPLTDPRWEGLAHGTLSSEDAAALAELAARSDTHRQAFEAFRPLGADARGRIAAKLLEGIQARPRPAEGRPEPAAVVVPFPRRQRWLWVVAAAAVLGGAVWLAPPGAPGGGALPAYAMTVTSGDRDVRALTPTTEPPRLGAGGRLEIGLRPATRARSPVAVVAFLVHDGRAQAWEVPAVIAETGAVRVEGTREALFAGVPAGQWEMVFAVGPPGALPSADEVASGREHASYRLLRQPILLLPAGGSGDPR
jgi:hypothetical protein